MDFTRARPRQALRISLIVAVALLSLGLGLGRSGRLTYHEAFVAQAARELIQSGTWLVPSIDHRPWLEKPPLPFWLVKVAALISGQLDEAVARVPSVLAALALILGISHHGARRFSPKVGLLAGLIQATTLWTITRGRLAEADILLAALVTWTLLMVDRLRGESHGTPRAQGKWRDLIVFALLGLTFLVKGLGFGAVLIAAVVATLVGIDRDRVLLRRLFSIRGLLLTVLIALPWPVAVLFHHPQAWRLWTLHIADRLADHPEHFAGGSSWWFYLPVVLSLVLPWTPFALIGVYKSLRRAVRERYGPDRLLWAWAIAPLVLLSFATVKNGHYAIHALPPWSIWAASGAIELGERLKSRGWNLSPRRVGTAFIMLGMSIGLGHLLIVPSLDRRGREWSFYAEAGRRLKSTEAVTLIYDDWDRNPYPSPFGPFPHDLAVRLFYLDRPANWCQGVDQLTRSDASRPFAVIARERDMPGLVRLGRVETLAVGPDLRWDRMYRLYLIEPDPVARTESRDLRR